MNKNIKRMFFVLTLVTLLATVGAVCAADDTNSTAAVDSSVSDVATVSDSASDTVAAEPVQTTSNDNNVDTKTIEKEEKNLKKDSISIDGIEYNTIYENQELNENVFIKEGTFPWSPNTFTINSNTYINNCNITGASTSTNNKMSNQNNYVLIVNSIIKANIETYKTLIVKNSTLNSTVNNNGNLTITNSTLNSTVNNNGNLTISDDCIIGDGFRIMGNGQLIINDTTRVGIYQGNMNVENRVITKKIEIPTTGNITFTGCNITEKITNKGNVTFIDCNFSNNDKTLLENKGYVNLINCTVDNNTGNNILIVSTGDLNIINSTFSNNTCTIINVNNTNKTRTINVNITNNTFSSNKGINLDKSSFDSIVNINDNIFSNSGISCSFNSTNIENNSFVDSYIRITNNKVNANNRIVSNIFNNTTITSPFLTAYNNTFNYGNLASSDDVDYMQFNYTYFDVYNNTFNNASLNIYCGIWLVNSFDSYAEPGSDINNTVYNNIFNGKANNNDVIKLIYPDANKYTKIFNNTYIKTSINDSMDYEINPKIYVNDTIKFNYQINNPIFYDSNILDNVTYNITIDDAIYALNTNNNTVKINSSGEHTIKITPSISSTTFTKTIDVLTLSDVIITPDNYNKYIKDDTLTRVNEDDRIIFQGVFNDKGEILIDTSDIVIDGENAEFTNTQFILDASNIIIQNMKIKNTNSSYVISNSKRNNYILNNNINLTNTDGQTVAIKNNAANTQIKNNIIYVDGPAKTIDYSSENGLSNTQAILITNANKNTIQNNTLTVTTTQQSEEYGTIEAITAKGITNTLITQNTINVSNAKFSYGINSLSEVSDNSITENNITVTGYRYCDGIQVGNQAENIIIDSNNINIFCHNTTPVDEEAISYGIITTNMDQGKSTEIKITNNNITINSTVGYGIEVYKTTDTDIQNNTILVMGVYSMGIGYAHSPKSTVINNTISIIGDSTQTLSGVTEEIQPENVGIKIQQDSTNIKIDDGWIYGREPIGPNTIHTNDKAGTDYAINVESTGATISSNKLTCSNGIGNNAIKNNTPVTIEYANYKDTIFTHITLDVPNETLINTTIPIKISIEDEYGKALINTETLNKIQNTITLTINNQNITYTLQDEIYTYNYTPSTTGTYNITATYEGNTSNKYNATKTTKTLEVFEIKLLVDPITTKAKETINISAKITIGKHTYTNITKGKVTFKVNGKTLKDANGKVIYAKVVNGTATIENYLIPDDWAKEGTTIQAVYSGSTQCDKLTSEKTNITIIADEPTLTTEDVTATAGDKITLKATITDNNKAINTGKIVFKINGKTVKDENGKVIYTKVVNNTVEFEYTLPESYKAGSYNITATFISADYDRLTDSKTLTVN